MPPIPKPTPRRILKARARRHAREVVTVNRQYCVLRDGYCRFEGAGLGHCGGPSQWSHLPGQQRWETRGQDPEARHNPKGVVQACALHHDAIDNRRTTERLVVEAVSEELGADWALTARRGTTRRVELRPKVWREAGE